MQVSNVTLKCLPLNSNSIIKLLNQIVINIIKTHCQIPFLKKMSLLLEANSANELTKNSTS